MVRRSPDNRQAGGEVHALLEGQGLERCQPLVVVHGQGGVEAVEVAQSEIAVGGVGTEGGNSFLVGLLDGRKDDLLLFIAQQAAVAAVRVEAQDGNARVVDAEIPLERLLHQPELAHDLFR